MLEVESEFEKEFIGNRTESFRLIYERWAEANSRNNSFLAWSSLANLVCVEGLLQNKWLDKDELVDELILLAVICNIRAADSLGVKGESE